MCQQKISWKDTNLSLIGSDIDHKCKEAAAQGEDAWEGIGESPELRVWRIEKFTVKPWPKEQYGEFFKGDSYIVMNTYKEDDSDALKHDIHIWIGEDSTQDEYGTAAYKMVEADDFLGGALVQHRQIQGKESEEFRSYFDSLRYHDGGVESGFNHVEPTVEKPVLFRVKASGKQIAMTQMPLSKSSLNEGDSFILYGGKDHVWCWNGKDSKPLEKAKANVWAGGMCTLGSVKVIDQGDGDEDVGDFWEYLGEGEIAPAEATVEPITEFKPLLFRVDANPDIELKQVAEGCLHQFPGKPVPVLEKDILNEDDVFLMDSGWEVFVWIGRDADTSEKIAAMGAADRYAQMEPRIADLPITIVKSGKESPSFKSCFGM
ncbi:unnamed protein product [Cylindrotheca closterium]|uniref:Gelsolin-like domain-containing protein n=1 Tax=Cylindrotheca closterium TaxID=2856 RepID=A0AAD2CEH1_9STRA|nr:unnamed protein product [Cylindrotheca closterium]